MPFRKGLEPAQLLLRRIAFDFSSVRPAQSFAMSAADFDEPFLQFGFPVTHALSDNLQGV